MHVDSDDVLLEKCRTIIEQKLGWGSSAIWTNHDFETLSQKIEEATKVNLSAVTLKRIWKKVKYNSKPTVTTLDTLAQFIGYENWRVFKLEQGKKVDDKQALSETEVVSPVAIKKNRRPVWTVVFLLIVVMLIGLAYGRLDQARTERGDDETAPYSFSSKKVVTEGVPNSVIFNYDATRAGDSDSIYIQQSWDERLRERVGRTEHTHTSIYYYPGFFIAKLVVNNEIVKEHHFHIRTSGWLPLIEQPGVPVYFEEKDVIKNDGAMRLGLEKLTENSVSLQPVTPWVAYHNSREFGDIRTDDVVFETEVKNEYGEGAGICQHTEIHLRIEGGLLMIPLSIKGCVSGLELIDMDGKKADTSGLGCDFSDWVNVKLVSRGGHGELFIDGEKKYDLNFKFPSVRIVALLYRFQGTGSVNFVRLSKHDGTVVYEDNF